MLAFCLPLWSLAQVPAGNQTDTPVPELNDSTDLRLVEIDKVFVLGNKKTRERIILREVMFTAGDTLRRYQIARLIQRSKNNLRNTRLFLDTEITALEVSDTKIDIVVKVTERWYIFPIPIFKLADRNFNEWWVNQDRDFNRVDYGIKFFHYNMRGRGERLRLVLQNGFTERYELNYSIPYLDKAQRNGMILSLNYIENNTVAYRSFDHRQQFTRSEENLRQVYLADVSWSHRRSFNEFHYVSLRYSKTAIADTLANLNPDYLLNGRTEQQYFLLQYQYTRDYRNNVAYPLNGSLFTALASKTGLGIFDDIDLYQLRSSYHRYIDLKKGFYLSGLVRGKLSTLNQQPYFNFRGLGYRLDMVRGLELNVIEAQYFVLNKLTLKKRLFSKKAHIGLIPFREFRNIPLAVYVKAYFDSGYAGNNFTYENNTRLTNRYIYGGGVGLDFVSFYDFVLRTEYSFNLEGERGLFLNFKAAF